MKVRQIFVKDAVRPPGTPHADVLYLVIESDDGDRVFQHVSDEPDDVIYEFPLDAIRKLLNAK